MNFMNRFKKPVDDVENNVPEENIDKHFIPDGFNFLADKIKTVED